MSDLQQILAGTPVTVTETFRVDGDPINTDSTLPTLALFKPDGTAYTPVPTVLDSWAGPPARSTGQYRFVLPAQATPYKLRYRLTGVIGGQPVTLQGWVEWIGASLFTEVEFRGLRVGNGLPFAANAVPAYSDAQIMDTRAAILDEMCDVLGYSPVPRYALETHSGGYDVIVNEHYATELLAITVSGTTQLVSGYYMHPSGVLRPYSNYQVGVPIVSGLGNVRVEYVHGLPRVPGNGSHVAMLWAAAQLNPSGFSSASTVSMPDGSTYTYEPSETGRGGFQRFTGIREVDRWLNRHAESMAA